MAEQPSQPEPKQAFNQFTQAYQALISSVVRLTKPLVSSGDSQPLPALLLAILQQVIDYEAGCVWLLENDRFREIDCINDASYFREAFQSHLNDGVVSWVCEEKRITVLPDIKGCFILVPVFTERQLISIVDIALSCQATAVSTNTLEIMEILAAHTANTYERRRLNEWASKIDQFLAMLKEIASETELERLLHLAASDIERLLGVDSCSIMMLDQEKQELYIAAAIGLPEEVIEKTRIPIGEGISGYVARTGQPLFIEDSSKDKRFDYTFRDSYQSRSILSIPLMRGDTVVGVLNATHRNSREQLKPLDRALLELFAGQVAIAIGQAKLLRRLLLDKKEWESTFDSMTDAITIYDSTARLVRANRAAARILGMSQEELMGKKLSRLFAAQESISSNGSYPEYAFRKASEVEKWLREVFEHGRSVLVDAELPGKGTMLRMAIDPILDERGYVLGGICVARDVTSEKKIQEALMQSDKLRALGEMASGVAHNFNNVLSVILGRAQMLKMRVGDAGLARELEIIVQAATDASRTIKRIQEFARLRVDPELAPVKINQIISETIAITRPRWKDEVERSGRHIDLRAELKNEFVVLGDPAELREVLINLIFNAVDAMPNGGRLTISTDLEPGDNQVLIKVTDTGTGMSEEVRQNIFHPFFTTKGTQGTGLGLSVSYGIVARHQGSIAVESAVGAGTTMLIRLPLHQAEAKEKIQEIKTKPNTGRILIIDDEPAVRHLLSDILLLGGHSVVSVSDGQSGLAAVERQQFDLVLTDLGMPGMTGWEVARAVKRTKPNLIVALITGWGGTIEPPLKGEHNVDLIINKPFQVDQILDQISRALAQRQ